MDYQACQAQPGNITTLQGAIRLQRRQRNELSPVSRLPAEVLGRAFSFASNESIPLYRDSPEDYEEADLPTPPSPAIRYNFSFVSQDWRQVALGTPRIWRIATTASPRWLELVLQRSRASGLTFYAFIPVEGIESREGILFAEVVRDHAPRITELTICLAAGVIYNGQTQRVLEALPKSCPRLHTLCIDLEFLHDLASVRLRPSVPAGRLIDSNLRTLRLTGCNMDWKASFLPNVTCMEIGPVYSSPSTAEFTQALRQMQNLEHLSLNNTLPSDRSSTAVMNEPISLGHLRSLRVLSIIDILPRWIGALSIPSTAAIEINCFTEFGRGESIASAEQLDALTKSIDNLIRTMVVGPGAPPLKIDTLELSRTSKYRIRFRAWREPWIGGSSEWFREDRHSFELSIHGVNVDDLEAVISKVIPVLPCDYINALLFKLVQPLSVELVQEIFGCLSVRSIIADRHITQHLVQALYPTSRSSTSALLFSSLRELYLVYPDFAKNPCDLKGCLIARKLEGASLSKLAADRAFGLDAGERENLKALVSHLEWNPESDCFDTRGDELFLEVNEAGFDGYDYFDYGLPDSLR